MERPKADWEVCCSLKHGKEDSLLNFLSQNLTKTRASEEVYKSLVKGVQTSSVHRSPGLRHLLCNEVMQLEFAPLINRIISPPLRPVRWLIFSLVRPGIDLSAAGKQPGDETARTCYAISFSGHYGLP